MWEIFAFALWLCFLAYALWYYESAKDYAPLTAKEAEILWKIHKQHTKCNGGKWLGIRREDKIVGFECACGYRHIQKRPIVSNKPKN